MNVVCSEILLPPAMTFPWIVAEMVVVFIAVAMTVETIDAVGGNGHSPLLSGHSPLISGHSPL